MGRVCSTNRGQEDSASKEMSTRNIPGGGVNGQSAHKADNLTAIYEPIVQKIWEPEHLTTLWAFTASYRDSLTFFTFYLR
jgi:hypothetical protein